MMTVTVPHGVPPGGQFEVAFAPQAEVSPPPPPPPSMMPAQAAEEKAADAAKAAAAAEANVHAFKFAHSITE
jgi:hypothetical protein